MRRCINCGRLGIFSPLDTNGRCPVCAAAFQRNENQKKLDAIVKKLEEEEKRRKEAEERHKRRVERVNEDFLRRLNAIPIQDFTRMPAKAKKLPQANEPWPNPTNVTKRSSMEKLGDFVAVDVETTGLKSEEASIIEFSAIRFKAWQPVLALTSLVSTQRHIPQEATKINGITDEMIAGKPKFPLLVPDIQAFISDSPLVGHNIIFDLDFLTYNGIHVFDIKRKYYDTLQLARKAYPTLENHKLDTLCRGLDIREAGLAHRSLSDCLATGELFYRVCNKIINID